MTRDHCIHHFEKFHDQENLVPIALFIWVLAAAAAMPTAAAAAVLYIIRIKHIAPYYRYSPSLDKLKELFCNRGRKLFKLARFLKEASNLI